MTQDERVIFAGLFATPCILVHCCSESGQSENSTSKFPTRQEKAALSPTLVQLFHFHVSHLVQSQVVGGWLSITKQSIRGSI